MPALVGGVDLRITRREFLQVGIASGMAAVASGCGPSILFPRSLDVGSDSFRVLIRRAEDFVCGEVLIRGADVQQGRLRPHDGRVLVVLVLPPQHIAERSFPDEQDPKAILGALEPAEMFDFAPPTRLVFELASKDLLGELELHELLAALERASLRVSPIARKEPEGKPAEPTDLETAIHFPSRLVLSPNETARFRHPSKVDARKGWVELWNSRLDTRQGVRAVWSPDLIGASAPRERYPDVEPTTLFDADRRDIVLRTTRFGDPSNPAKDVSAELLALTSLGALARLEGEWPRWNGVPARTDLIGWTHRTALGRDSFVRTIRIGVLYPWQHTAAMIEIDERKPLATGRGATDEAVIVNRTLLRVLEPRRDYVEHNGPETRGNAYKWLELIDLETPPLDRGSDIIVPHPDDTLAGAHARWIRVRGRHFRFRARAADQMDTAHDVAKAAIWISDVAKDDPQVLETVAKAWGADAEARRSAFFGHKLALVKSDDALGTLDDGRLVTESVTFVASKLVTESGGHRLSFAPSLERAWVEVPGTRELLVGAQATAERLAGEAVAAIGSLKGELERLVEAPKEYVERIAELEPLLDATGRAKLLEAKKAIEAAAPVARAALAELAFTRFRFRDHVGSRLEQVLKDLKDVAATVPELKDLSVPSQFEDFRNDMAAHFTHLEQTFDDELRAAAARAEGNLGELHRRARATVDEVLPPFDLEWLGDAVGHARSKLGEAHQTLLVLGSLPAYTAKRQAALDALGKVETRARTLAAAKLGQVHQLVAELDTAAQELETNLGDWKAQGTLRSIVATEAQRLDKEAAEKLGRQLAQATALAVAIAAQAKRLKAAAEDLKKWGDVVTQWTTARDTVKLRVTALLGKVADVTNEIRRLESQVSNDVRPRLAAAGRQIEKLSMHLQSEVNAGVDRVVQDVTNGQLFAAAGDAVKVLRGELDARLVSLSSVADAIHSEIEIAKELAKPHPWNHAAFEAALADVANDLRTRVEPVRKDLGKMIGAVSATAARLEGELRSYEAGFADAVRKLTQGYATTAQELERIQRALVAERQRIDAALEDARKAALRLVRDTVSVDLSELERATRVLLDEVSSKIAGADAKLRKAVRDATGAAEQALASVDVASLEGAARSAVMLLEQHQAVAAATVRAFVAEATRIRKEAGAALQGALATSEIAYAKAYLENGFAAINASHRIYADLVRSLPTSFDVRQLAGLAAPDLNIAALSLKHGPVAAAADVLQGKFDPKAYFPDAKIIGGVLLREILAGVFDENALPHVQRVLRGEEVGFRYEYAVGPSGFASHEYFKKTSETQLDLTFEAWGKRGARPTVRAEAILRKFGLRFFEVLRVDLGKVEYRNGRFDFAIENVTFEGSLSFFTELSKYLSVGDEDSGPYARIKPTGLIAGVAAGLPEVGVGVLALQGIVVRVELELPFDGSGAIVRMAFSSFERPFRITVAFLAGGGFIEARMRTTGPRSIERLSGALEFGGSVAVGFGFASGSAAIMAGFFVERTKRGSLVMGYYRLSAHLDVLGIVSVSVVLLLGLAYQSEGKRLYGFAKIIVRVKIFFFSRSFEHTIEREFSSAARAVAMVGAIPRLVQKRRRDVMKNGKWQQHARAFDFALLRGG